MFQSRELRPTRLPALGCFDVSALHCSGAMKQVREAVFTTAQRRRNQHLSMQEINLIAWREGGGGDSF